MSWIMTGAVEAEAATATAVDWQAGLITPAPQEKLLLSVREGSLPVCTAPPHPHHFLTPQHLHLVRIESN